MSSVAILLSMPNVRSLLAKGIRFTRAWSNPLCSPTRAGILTGRYSFRTGIGDAVGGTPNNLDTAEFTFQNFLNFINHQESLKLISVNGI
jgi:arylsulfatase A-like enzyme